MDSEGLQREGLAAIAEAGTLEALESVRVGLLGRKGRVTGLMQRLGTLPAEARKPFGAAVNAVKESLLAAIAARRERLAGAALAQRLAAERVDITLPARPEALGRIHPVTQTIDAVVAIFGEMGFSLAEGPDIEDDFHNFTALNFPEGHPAREAHDTFYFPQNAAGERMLLRTHTSPVQVRSMQGRTPPIRVIAPGRTYRSDHDQTHSPMFHQVEGLLIDEATHMGHLKGCLMAFIKAYFELDRVQSRFRASFFPFTSPSGEIDIRCRRRGDELTLGEGEDWLEIAGCGMVHPNVLRACGIDPERYQGFAFGMGIERIAMLKHGIADLRPFYDSDRRWLDHYGFHMADVPSLITGLGR